MQTDCNYSKREKPIEKKFPWTAKSYLGSAIDEQFCARVQVEAGLYSADKS